MIKHVENHISYFKVRVKQQLIYMVFFSFLFFFLSVGVKFSADIYYRYFDKTDYYKIEVPVAVDKKAYQPCKEVNLFMHRESLVKTQGDAVIGLTLVRTDGLKKRVYQYSRKIVINQSHETVVVPFLLPCEIAYGNYYFEGDIRYYVGDIAKSAHYFTNIFIVGAEEKIATPSGELLPI